MDSRALQQSVKEFYLHPCACAHTHTHTSLLILSTRKHNSLLTVKAEALCPRLRAFHFPTIQEIFFKSDFNMRCVFYSSFFPIVENTVVICKLAVVRIRKLSE